MHYFRFLYVNHLIERRIRRSKMPSLAECITSVRVCITNTNGVSCCNLVAENACKVELCYKPTSNEADFDHKEAVRQKLIGAFQHICSMISRSFANSEAANYFICRLEKRTDASAEQITLGWAACPRCHTNPQSTLRGRVRKKQSADV
jgi:hypothetical protein